MFYTFFRQKWSVLLSLALVLITAGGCRSTVAEVKDEPFFGATKNADLNQVTQKIIEAGQRRRVNMQVIAPGHIEATYAKRNVKAVMDIKYNTERFSITYKDSYGLGYDAADITISSHYNSWVKNLKADISRIYPLPLSGSGGTTSPKTHDTTKTELMPPKPELSDSI